MHGWKNDLRSFLRQPWIDTRICGQKFHDAEIELAGKGIEIVIGAYLVVRNLANDIAMNRIGRGLRAGRRHHGQQKHGAKEKAASHRGKHFCNFDHTL
jgi:hypothetical protein